MLCDACREEHPLLDREQGSVAQYIILPGSNIWLCDPIQKALWICLKHRTVLNE
jgi:hypothetical protein